ncbi:MAG: methyl-accepting chemotaxis protein [Thiohalospira sp.]
MHTPVLHTRAALDVLNAALDADYARLQDLTASRRSTVRELADVSASIAEGNRRLVPVSRQGVTAMGRAVDLLVRNGYFTKEIGGIRDNAASVASAVEEMSSSAREVAGLAQSTSERARESRQRTEEGNQGLSSLIGDMDLLETSVDTMASAMEQFVNSTAEINKLTATVKEIADQTNLLALNAAIEAARAGEAGRGFAVVADEVRSLAEKTAEATESIDRVTGTMNGLSGEVNSSVTDARDKLGNSVEAMDQVASSLAESTNVAAEVDDQVHQIATAAEQQSTVAEEMAQNVAAVTHSLDNETSQVHEVSAIAEDVARRIHGQLNELAAWGHDEIILQVVKGDHLMWKIKLAKMILGEESLPEEELTDHHQCRLGKWIDGPGKECYGQSEAFQAMADPHQQVHALGRTIRDLVAEGRIDEATERLEQMEVLSQRLFARLDELTAEAVGDEAGGSP